uniref:Homeobox domain-containing protein n=1 Tax=Periophthalmus magnuspinnatus TaxID=409849 RepID=A0A3B3ZCF4_9GOBI
MLSLQNRRLIWFQNRRAKWRRSLRETQLHQVQSALSTIISPEVKVHDSNLQLRNYNKSFINQGDSFI